MDPTQIARLTIDVHNILVHAAEKAEIDIKISEQVLVEVCKNFRKEMDKLERHQGEHISITKRAVALAFWIRRLKPIYWAALTRTSTESGASPLEVTDINEKAAVWLVHLLLGHGADAGSMPAAYQRLPISGKAAAFKSYLKAFWALDGHWQYSSLVYAMRYRNISPHHLALYFDAVISGFVLKHT